MEILLIGIDDFKAFKVLSGNTDFTKVLSQYVLEAQNLDLKPALSYPLFYDLFDKYGKENLAAKYKNLTVSSFQVGETVTADNGATATVVSDATPNLVLSDLTGNWEAAKDFTGAASGAKADVDVLTFGNWYQFINGAKYTDYLGFATGYDGVKPALVYWAYARYIERGQELPTATGLVTKTTPYSEPLSARAVADKAAQAREAAVSYWGYAEKFLYDRFTADPTTFPLYAKTLYLKRQPSGGIKISSINRYDRENRGNSGSRIGRDCPDGGYGH